MTQDPTPRTAVISGGSSGIGRAMVKALHVQGVRVWTCGRDAAKLQRLEQECPGVRTFVCDVADASAVRRFAEAVQLAAPRVDLLVSNAGGLREVDFTASGLADQDLAAEMRVNFEGALHLITHFLPAVRAASPASIIVVSSGYGLAPAARAPIYSAAKAALHSLCKALRRQLAPLGINVTELLPPLVDTPAVAHRTGKKISADTVARLALDGAQRGLAEVRPGDVRWLPLMLRLLPGLTEKIVAGT